MFEGAAIGIKDKHGNDIRNGDYVRFYYKGEYVICQVVYKPEWALFCLKWSDGYINKYPMDGLILEITDKPEIKK